MYEITLLYEELSWNISILDASFEVFQNIQSRLYEPVEQHRIIESTLISVSDRRGSGKPRPKSEGFELYNNTAQNGSPESPQLPWTEYSEPKKLPGDDRLMKNRADHRSSPNVASKRNHSLRVFGHWSEWGTLFFASYYLYCWLPGVEFS